MNKTTGTNYYLIGFIIGIIIVISILIYVVISSSSNQQDNVKLQYPSLCAGCQNFYYETLLNPLFYGGDEEFSQFNNLFDKADYERYDKCIDYDVKFFPTNYYIELDKTKHLTDMYLSNPSFETAEELLEQQEATAFAYINDVEDFYKSTIGIEDYDENFFMTTDKLFSVSGLQSVLQQYSDNGYEMLKEIDRRRNILYNSELLQFRHKEYPLPELSRMNKIDRSDSLLPEEAKHYMKLLLNVSADDKKERERIDMMSLDRFYIFELYIDAFDKNVNVYGLDADFYPNLFYADKTGELSIFRQKEYVNKYESDFVSCKSPYYEDEIVTWHVMLDIYKSIKNTTTRAEKYEKTFLANPTEHNLEVLKDVYAHYVFKDFFSGKKQSDTNIIWQRYTKLYSKAYIIPKVLDIRDIGESMYYFNQNDDRSTCSGYREFILIESLFYTTYMPWSESVWQLPDFDRHTQPFNNTDYKHQVDKSKEWQNIFTTTFK